MSIGFKKSEVGVCLHFLIPYAENFNLHQVETDVYILTGVQYKLDV